MAKVSAFRGWRYDLAKVGSLSEVVAPPYDVINTEQQNALYDLHPNNVVRLILNREEEKDSDTTRYKRAARFLKDWKRENILEQDKEDCYYVYHQEFDWEGTRYVRKGFLGRLQLEEFGEGKVFPHEQTMPGPKKDRLALLEACQTNLSPIFGLFPDALQEAQETLEDAINGQTPFEISDEQGVIHRLWPVSQVDAVHQVEKALADKSIFIADGHHRYETALNYRRQLIEAGEIDSDQHPANSVLMMFVGMSDPGLAILPTHRLISNLPEMTQAELSTALENNFKLTPMGTGSQAAQETWEAIEMHGNQSTLGFGTASDQQWLLAELIDDSPMAELAAEQSDEWRELGVSLLHKLVLEHLIPKHFSGSDLSWKYVHLMSEVNNSLTEKTCQLAALVPPAGIEHVQIIASNLEKMPPKSTFFYPKLLSGLVFNPLK